MPGSDSHTTCRFSTPLVHSLHVIFLSLQFPLHLCYLFDFFDVLIYSCSRHRWCIDFHFGVVRVTYPFGSLILAIWGDISHVLHVCATICVRVRVCRRDADLEIPTASVEVQTDPTQEAYRVSDWKCVRVCTCACVHACSHMHFRVGACVSLWLGCAN